MGMCTFTVFPQTASTFFIIGVKLLKIQTCSVLLNKEKWRNIKSCTIKELIISYFSYRVKRDGKKTNEKRIALKQVLRFN